MPKVYDHAYFDKWYRHPRHAVASRAELARKVAMVVAVAEYYLGRRIENVLDVGCGEAPWRAPLLALRPKARYLGFDSSEYAIRRYGARRNLHFARFADFAHLRPCAPVDLLVCSDVMHYLPTRELAQGLPGLADLCGGVAFLEAFAKEDETEGDDVGFQPRPAKFYRERFAALGFRFVGSHCWLSPALAEQPAALEAAPH